MTDRITLSINPTIRLAVFDWESVYTGQIYCLRCQRWMSIIDASNNDVGDSHVIDHINAYELMREIDSVSSGH